MQFSIRQLLFLVLAVALACWGGLSTYTFIYAPGDDDHFSGVGSAFGIELFAFTSNGARFELNEMENGALEAEWKLCCFETSSQLHDKKNTNCVEREFECLLSDGYRINSECKFAEVDDKSYLELEPVAEDGSGFQPDFNYLRIDLGNVLGHDRMLRLRQHFSPD